MASIHSSKIAGRSGLDAGGDDKGASWVGRLLTIVIVGMYGSWRAEASPRGLLMEFRSQSQRLQDEMAGDVERLQDQLAEADAEVDQVRANLITLTRQA